MSNTSLGVIANHRVTQSDRYQVGTNKFGVSKATCGLIDKVGEKAFGYPVDDRLLFDMRRRNIPRETNP